MKITVLTLFPEMYDSFLSNSIIKRAIARNLIEIKLVNFRNYTTNKYHRVDSPPVGGGAGLILMCQPIIDALKDNSSDSTHKIVLSPRGSVFNQQKAIHLSKKDEILILCGHYEGIDERVYKYFDEEISIGDYILTGGETASFVLIDAISRLIKGVISEDSIKEETFNSPFIEYPQYAEPYEFEGEYVPDILYSGNHQAIEKYRLKKSIEYTFKYRPDLVKDYQFSKKEKELIEEINSNKTPSWEEKTLLNAKKFIKNH